MSIFKAGDEITFADGIDGLDKYVYEFSGVDEKTGVGMLKPIRKKSLQSDNNFDNIN